MFVSVAILQRPHSLHTFPKTPNTVSTRRGQSRVVFISVIRCLLLNNTAARLYIGSRTENAVSRPLTMKSVRRESVYCGALVALPLTPRVANIASFVYLLIPLGTDWFLMRKELYLQVLSGLDAHEPTALAQSARSRLSPT